jgi:hypothetical protein
MSHQLSATLSRRASEKLWKAVIGSHLSGSQKQEGAKMAKRVSQYVAQTAHRFHRAKEGFAALQRELADARTRLEALSNQDTIHNSVIDEYETISRACEAILRTIRKPKPKAQQATSDGSRPILDGANDESSSDLTLPSGVALFGFAGAMLLMKRKKALLGDLFTRGRVWLWLSAFSQFIATLGLSGWPLDGLGVKVGYHRDVESVEPKLCY